MQKTEVLKLGQEAFLLQLKTSANGLSAEEAQARVVRYGLNTFGKKTANMWKVLGNQFQSALIYLLIIATVISYSIGDSTNGTVILIILLVNTLLGFFQEYKSEKIVEQLSRYISAEADVLRNAVHSMVETSHLVPGDVVTVREGDMVPADMRLIEANDLLVNESQLTGESVPLHKQPSLMPHTEPTDLLFAGSSIEKGTGKGVVYGTGRETEWGTIARLSTETKKQTEYQKSLGSFSIFLMKVTLFGLALVFVMKLILNGGFSNLTVLLLFVIATAVSVVPEVLPVVASTTLSIGAMKLSKRQVVVKRLSAVEDLGNVNVLCTDKTGTITENKMSISRIISFDEVLLQTFACASAAPFHYHKHKLQNSYDSAFSEYVTEPVKHAAKSFTILKELPFDPSDRVRKVLLSDAKTHRRYAVVIGAPEVILQMTNDSKKNEYLKAIEEEDRTGMHHVAFAYKEIPTAQKEVDLAKDTAGAAFLGYVSFRNSLLKKFQG